MPDTAAPWEPIVDGTALRLARAAKGWTLGQLARACSDLGTPIDRGNLSRAEHSKPGALGFQKLPTVAAALGMTVEELLTAHGKALPQLERAS